MVLSCHILHSFIGRSALSAAVISPHAAWYASIPADSSPAIDGAHWAGGQAPNIPLVICQCSIFLEQQLVALLLEHDVELAQVLLCQLDICEQLGLRGAAGHRWAVWAAASWAQAERRAEAWASAVRQRAPEIRSWAACPPGRHFLTAQMGTYLMTEPGSLGPHGTSP